MSPCVTFTVTASCALICTFIYSDICGCVTGVKSTLRGSSNSPDSTRGISAPPGCPAPGSISMLCSFHDYPLTWRGLEASLPTVPQVSQREKPCTPWGTEVVACPAPLPSLAPTWLPLPSLALEGPSPLLTQSTPAPINMGCPDQGHPWRSPWESTGRGQRCLSRSKWLSPS